MAQGLKTLATLLEDLGLSSTTNMAAHSYL